MIYCKVEKFCLPGRRKEAKGNEKVLQNDSAFGGSGEAAGFRNGDKIGQLSGIHKNGPFFYGFRIKYKILL